MPLTIKDYGKGPREYYPTDRAGLEKKVGQVWNTEEAKLEFTIHGFAAPLVIVTRKSDGQRGVMEFTHFPRFFFSFREHQS